MMSTVFRNFKNFQVGNFVNSECPPIETTCVTLFVFRDFFLSAVEKYLWRRIRSSALITNVSTQVSINFALG